jgi:lysophospholipase L1-like esterase
VEEEGLSGRTTVFDDPMDGRRNGLKSLDYCLFTNSPIDLLIIMLGSNDIKEHLGQTPFSIACGLEQLIAKAKNGQYGPEGGSPGILVISPPRLRDNLDGVWPGAEFGKGHREKDEQLKGQYMRVAEKHGCHFLCAADYAETSKNDGVHMDAENHAKLAGAVYETVREIFKR